jgi:ABC-type multidrug transport system permease subunit
MRFYMKIIGAIVTGAVVGAVALLAYVFIRGAIKPERLDPAWPIAIPFLLMAGAVVGAVVGLVFGLFMARKK